MGQIFPANYLDGFSLNLSIIGKKKLNFSIWYFDVMDVGWVERGLYSILDEQTETIKIDIYLRNFFILKSIFHYFLLFVAIFFKNSRRYFNFYYNIGPETSLLN